MLAISIDTAHALDPRVLLSVAVMLFVAKIGGEIFERLKQPAVLGELLGGIALGGLALFGVGGVEFIRANEVIAALAEIGVIVLLFEVGLESSVEELFAVGWSSLLVAIVGVITPFLLGWGIAVYFVPNGTRLEHVFIGAVLCATSVGITARVLKDLGKLDTREARIILGAAVIDDVLGLIILAIVVGAVRAAESGTQLVMSDVAIIAGKSLAFLIGALLIGHFVVPRFFARLSRLQTRGVLISFAVAFCFALAWTAAKVGLAPIVGAFAAGLLLEEKYFAGFRARGMPQLEQLLAPVSFLFAPIFFVLMGVKVDLRSFARIELLGFAGALTIAAIIGKQVCAFAVLEKNIKRSAIGFGMIPRGEVGLIFAASGATLTLQNANGTSSPVIGAATFGTIVLTIIITTLVTPPMLKWSLMRKSEVGGD